MKFNIFKRKEILHGEEELAMHEERKLQIKKEQSENTEAAKMLNQERALLGIM